MASCLSGDLPIASLLNIHKRVEDPISRVISSLASIQQILFNTLFSVGLTNEEILEKTILRKSRDTNKAGFWQLKNVILIMQSKSQDRIQTITSTCLKYILYKHMLLQHMCIYSGVFIFIRQRQ